MFVKANGCTCFQTHAHKKKKRIKNEFESKWNNHSIQSLIVGNKQLKSIITSSATLFV